MKIIIQDDEIISYIENSLVSFYKKGSLFPFIGAGFTKGCKARRGHVPDGKECVKLMKELIIREMPNLSGDLETIDDFDKIANIFYKVVPRDVILDFLHDKFTSIKLTDRRKDFVALRWEYIYTLNIDDAIEGHSDFKKILPNKSIHRRFIKNAVFKLHGDANDEVTYVENKGLIFSRKQYLQSLIENKDLLNIFFENYASGNFLFIGCSLDNEIDLEYILANNKVSSPNRTDKIYITDKVPTTLEQIKLEDFGINVCLVFDSYNSFYEKIVSIFSNVNFSHENIFNGYLVQNFEINSDNNYNKKMICGEDELNLKDNTIEIPLFFTHRDVTDNIVKLLTKEDIVFVTGKRVSGKTFLLYDIARNINNANVYCFPSQISFDPDFIDQLLNLKNSILIFDTDTLQTYDIEDIYYKMPQFNDHNIRFLFCINSSDRLMLSVAYSKLADKEIVELKNEMTIDEVAKVNEALSKIGIANVVQNLNFIGNIARHREIYNRNIIEFNTFYNNIDNKSLHIYILNAAFDKVYSSIYRALKIDYDNIQFAIEKSNKAIEFEFQISDLEIGQHSSYKVITNSKTFLFTILGNFISKSHNLSASVSAIVNTVEELKKYDRFVNYWKTLIAFDTLNQIFYKPSGGAIKLIFSIYDKLEPALYNDNHYWMQRAKSIFYLKRNDINELKRAIEYTKKPYYDSGDSSKIKISASLQIAMIYNRIVVLQKFKSLELLQEAIRWTCVGLKENMHNYKFIDDFLRLAKREKMRNDFYAISMHILENRDIASQEERDFILSKIFPNFKSGVWDKPGQ